MSHFKVLVVGEDVEEQLAPYDESLEVAPYPEENYSYEEDLKEARAAYGTAAGETVSDLEVMQWWHGPDVDLRTDEDGVVRRYTTYNPLSKWDWWSVGGRYTETFWDKSGFPVDSATKAEIDFDYAREMARLKAEADWWKLTKVTEGLTPPTRSWQETYDALGFEAARKEWRNHPWNVAVMDAFGPWVEGYNDFCMDADNPHEKYLQTKEAFAVGGFYAVVKNGKWAARGDMGWFGMSDDHMDTYEWYRSVEELIMNEPEDSILTVVDCHI